MAPFILGQQPHEVFYAVSATKLDDGRLESPDCGDQHFKLLPLRLGRPVGLHLTTEVSSRDQHKFFERGVVDPHIDDAVASFDDQQINLPLQPGWHGAVFRQFGQRLLKIVERVFGLNERRGRLGRIEHLDDNFGRFGWIGRGGHAAIMNRRHGKKQSGG